MEGHSAMIAPEIQPDAEAPILRLPPEILVHILDIARDNNPKLTINLVASQVSSLWRSIVLSNSLWWSKIAIFPPWKLELIRTYLERSQICPLTLDISIHADFHDRSQEDPLPQLSNYEQLCDLLRPHFHRCQAIRIQGVFVEASDVVNDLLRPLQGMDFPFLEEFVVHGEDSEGQYVLPSPIPIFSTAPRLADVRLGGLGVLRYTPPFTSVTTLHLSAATHHIPYHYLFQTLQLCPVLSSLSIYDDLLNAWPGPSVTCEMPSLKSLQIFGNMLTVSELLLFLSAPELKELVIAPVIGGDLTMFLTHAGSSSTRFPKLKHLTLAPAHPEAFESLPVASSSFPNIETLLLATVYPRPFLEVFTREGTNLLFPNLLHLTLDNVNDAILVPIKRMLEVRNECHRPLHRLSVDGKSMALLDRFPHLMTSDVDIEVSDSWEQQRIKAMHSDEEERFVGIAVTPDPEE